MGIDREVEGLDDLTGLGEYGEGRVLGLVLGSDDYLVAVERILVGNLLTEGDAVNHVLVPGDTG